MQHDRPTIKTACVQMRSGLDRRVNTEAALELIAAAARAGAEFVSTPEMTNIVDRSAKRLLANLAPEAELEEINAFAGAAKKHRIWLHIGSMAVKVSDDKAANRAFLFSPDGEIVARYDKLHMFDVQLPQGETWRESAIYAAGDKARAVETPFGLVGLTICYDVRFPHLYRALAQAGAEILCVPAAFTKQTGEAHWKTLLTARAIECGAFIVAAAQGGRHEDGRDTYGHSLIIGPWGEILADADDAEPGVIVAELDIARAAEARARIPNLQLEKTITVART